MKSLFPKLPPLERLTVTGELREVLPYSKGEALELGSSFITE